jgi:GGDEF domain-containing protein
VAPRCRRRPARSARTDALTRLFNHSAFLERLDAELSDDRTLALIATFEPGVLEPLA